MNPLETYLQDLRAVHGTGAGVPETSYYGCLERLLNELGKTLKPKVRCILTLANRGAGNPDGGLFTPDEIKKGAADPASGLDPSRGAIEVKAPAQDLDETVCSEQVERYCKKYGLVLVTNYRQFALVARDAAGRIAPLESFSLADSEEAFWAAAAHPRVTAGLLGERFTGYLLRVLQHNAPLADPKVLAWFLAHYAREALARVKSSQLPALASLRKALEESLGMKFRGDRGEHFFESTLIQTLFYGVFSAWVLWSKEHPPTDKTPFDWMHSASYLRVPVLRKLFHETADPGQLEALNLSEILNWAAAALNRVDRAAFFDNFEQRHAVQYFYEPFLEEYDPVLRKQLGVWYTPPEIVHYMVERADRVLRDELGIADGLADERVYVLDPCCGTGAFLVGVLDRIAATLKAKGDNALASHDLKAAVQKRIFGFEILPAPYVVSHLQLGLRLADLEVPLTGKQRVGVYLTNALTGWEPPKEPQALLPFVEFQEERDAADGVKQTKPILVILGNPPYNGFADVAMEEERDLSTAYRTTKKAPKPQGQGLNDLYIRFFRMAERRIVEKTHQGLICFISNYSWLDGLSHTGMRERYLEAFDKIWIDCLNGDKYKTGKLTPDGQPDPSVFSTEFNREGIQVGTAISLLVRKEAHADTKTVQFRHLWGKKKREELLESADQDDASIYRPVEPAYDIGCPFKSGDMALGYTSWPALPSLLPFSSPGVTTSRDGLVIGMDKEELLQKMEVYFDPNVPHEEVQSLCPKAMEDTGRFKARAVRAYLQKRGFLPERIVRFCYRPFDVRWLYWEPETKLLDEKRTAFFENLLPDNRWIEARQRQTKEFDRGYVSPLLCDSFGNGVSCFFPKLLAVEKTSDLYHGTKEGVAPNISEEAKSYLVNLGLEIGAFAADLLFMHIVAVMHSPQYRRENAGGLQSGWPRIPLPATRQALESSAALGRGLAALLDVQKPVTGVTTRKSNPELESIGLMTHAEGKRINDTDDLALTAGWGNPGRGGITMPGTGDARQRDLDRSESQTPASLGPATFDIYLNDRIYWRNIPQAVWEYTLGGYPVLKKWLSYREHKILGRPLRADEARYFTEMARRIAAILMMRAELDENYLFIRKQTKASYDLDGFPVIGDN